MTLENLHRLSAAEGARSIAEGKITSVQLVQACLARIRAVEATVQAWTFLDESYVLARAEQADEVRRSGAWVGALHGVPVGLKDIIDTADMPTENGSVLCAGRTPSKDAAVAGMLRAAGAIVMGKTVTTEFATRTPGKTRNPHNPAYTPGGSSSGSAAAVAAEMVPLAVGSQTGGSVIRPAAYCGVFGLKPTHGLIPRTGMFQLSRSLDHVGLFARTLEDLALGLEQVAGHDEGDPDSCPRSRVPYRAIAAEAPPRAPRFAFVKTPRWSMVTSDAQAALRELVGVLGDRVEPVEVEEGDAIEWQRIVTDVEAAVNLDREWTTGRDRLSPALRTRLERGRAILARDYLQALAQVPPLIARYAGPLEHGYDAILTPAAPGTAPEGLASTGDPMFNSVWTLCGMPAVTLPLMTGGNGLPLGVQLVGARHQDGRLLRTARWLVEHLRG